MERKEMAPMRSERMKRCALCAPLAVFFFTALSMAGEMRLPVLPNLPVFENTADTCGKTADAPENMLDVGGLDSVSGPADAQGTPGPGTEGVKANKRQIDYGAKTTHIGSRISDKNRGAEGGDQETWLQPVEGQAVAAPPPADLALGFDHRAPGLGRIGFERNYRGEIHADTGE
jgi:hypothetical protein